MKTRRVTSVLKTPLVGCERTRLALSAKLSLLEAVAQFHQQSVADSQDCEIGFHRCGCALCDGGLNVLDVYDRRRLATSSWTDHNGESSFIPSTASVRETIEPLRSDNASITRSCYDLVSGSIKRGTGKLNYIMTTNNKLLLLTLVFCLCFSTNADGEELKVFLLGGQSNIQGLGSVRELPPALQGPQDDVLIYFNSELRVLQPGFGSNSRQFGPEVSFGRALADAWPGENIALIKYGEGGTDLENNWDPVTGPSYRNFRTVLTRGLVALENNGFAPTIAGMLWTQGERDARLGFGGNYETNLNAFIGDVRSRYGGDLPFYFSQLSALQTNLPATGLNLVRQAQSRVATADENSHLIVTDTFGMLPDNLHFNAAGQVSLGEAFAAAVLAASRKPGFRVLQIINPSFEDDVIPRDGDPETVADATDDFDADLVPTGWTEFDDGRNNAAAGDARGIVSHASDAFFNVSLTNTPDQDVNDQSFFTAQRDIFQVLSDTLEANTTYTLSVDIGDLVAGSDGGASGTPAVNLGYGSFTGENVVLTLDQRNQPPQTDGDWVTWTGEFTTSSMPIGFGEQLRIELTNGTNVGWFDNVRLSATTVPEPTSLGMLAVGLFCLASRSR